MKLDVLQHDREVTSNSLKSKAYGIDTSQLGMLYQVLSQYSNPIGSLIRELATNAIDSHIEAKQDKRISVRITDGSTLTNSNAAFEVEDYGVGLSPDRVENVYSQFLASTKRDSNDEHGAYGLGSKSPFSYTDMFFVTTRYDGTEYFYALHKGSNSPTIELLDESPTEEPNGTTVNINIKPGNMGKFKDEVKRQLAYFDNVNHEGTSVSNDYRIFQGKHFIFREHAQDLNLDGVHICLGKVFYPIDSSIIKFETEQKSSYRGTYKTGVKTPIGLKFEIGDIPIMWSRENIEYTDKAIQLIKDKYEAAQEELKAMYLSQQDEVETVKEYFYLNGQTQADTLEVGQGVGIPYISHIVEIDLNFSKYERLPHFPSIEQTAGLVYKYHKSVENGVAKTPKYNNSLPDISLSKDADGEITSFKNHTSLYFLRNSYSTLKNKYVKEIKGQNYFKLIKKREGNDKVEQSKILTIFGYPDAYSFDDIDPDEVKLIKEYTTECIKAYLESVDDYDKDITVSEEFKQAKKGSGKVNMLDPTSDTYDKNLKLHLKEACNSVLQHSSPESSFSVYEPTVQKLLDSKNALRIYGFQEHSDTLEDVALFMHRAMPDLWQWSQSRHEKLSILKIAKNKEDILLELSENAIPVEEFLTRNSQILVRELTLYYIYSEIESNSQRPLGDLNFGTLKKLMEGLGMDEYYRTVLPAKKMVESIHNKQFPITGGYVHQSSNIPARILRVFEDPAYLDTSMLKDYQIAADYVNKYPLLYKLASSEELDEEVVEELKFYLMGKSKVHPSLIRRLEEYKKGKLLQSLKTTIHEDYNG